MDPPLAPPSFPSSSSSSNASATMVIITVVGILAAFALLASYYAFVTKCQPLRALWSRNNQPWNRLARNYGGGQMRGEPPPSSVIRAAVAGSEHRGLGQPLIRMLPVVKFTAEAGEHRRGAAARISVSECAVCLSEFEERERVRLLPNCSHAFHIDCIDTWLQGSARCPFCRSDVTLPLPARVTATTGHSHRRHHDDSIVIEVRAEHETRLGHEQASTRPPGRISRHRRQKRKSESVGDEAIDTRMKDEAFAVQPLRRSLSLDSSCGKHLYLSVQDYLATQRQVSSYDPSVI